MFMLMQQLLINGVGFLSLALTKGQILSGVILAIAICQNAN